MNGFCPWGLAAIVIVAIFVVFLLIFIRRTLRRVEGLIGQLEERLKTVDPALRAVGDIGEVFEKHTMHLKRLSDMTAEMLSEKRSCECRDEKRAAALGAAVGVAEWLIGGLALWKRYKNSR